MVGRTSVRSKRLGVCKILLDTLAPHVSSGSIRALDRFTSTLRSRPETKGGKVLQMGPGVEVMATVPFGQHS